MVVFFQGSYDNLKWFNDLMCRMTYLPIALIMTAGLMVYSAVLLPFVYLNHSLVLFRRIFAATSFKKVCKNIFTFLQFLTLGLGMLIISLILDPIQFFVYLFHQKEDQ
jgi:hypothetical protein